MSKKNFIIPVCVSLLFGGLIKPEASFAILIYQCQDMKYVASKAALIVRGQVLDVQSRKEKGGNPYTSLYTFITIKVDEYFRGKGPQTITIKQLGGRIEENGQIVEVSDGDTPQFKIGESGYLYLDRPDTPFYGGQFYTTVCATGISEGPAVGKGPALDE